LINAYNYGIIYFIMASGVGYERVTWDSAYENNFYGLSVPVPQIAAIDYDRVTADVEESFAHTLDAAARKGIDPEELQAARKLTEATDGSFSAFKYVAETHGTETAHDLSFAMVGHGRRIQPYPDVLPFRGRLDAGKVPRFYLSRGEQLGQISKLEATDSVAGYMVVPDADKGVAQRVIYRDKDGYRFAVVSTRPTDSYVTPSICLIDDREESFATWDGHGFCVRVRLPI
jgi:hypothetical protein